jgi:hypothetical protein
MEGMILLCMASIDGGMDLENDAFRHLALHTTTSEPYCSSHGAA